MGDPNLILLTKDIPTNLLSDLDHREIALWFRSPPREPIPQSDLTSIVGLPWQMVFLEFSDPGLIQALENSRDADDPITRKRGFVQIIDGDPTQIELPERCLPIYLLNGRHGESQDDFQSLFRRMAMLEVLRRSRVRQILIVSGDDNPIPPGLKDLWLSGFRSNLTFATDSENAGELLTTWVGELDGLAAVSLVSVPAGQILENILRRYSEIYPEERRMIRLRDQSGNLEIVDITEIDDPERPILEHYSLIEERDLTMLTPDQLSEEEFVSFFQNPESSWRPYAAGLPWNRDDQSMHKLGNYLKNLDTVGPEENCVAYVLTEPGAGGTTCAHMLAWNFACHGYPVLVAKSLPFAPNALPVANFMNRVRLKFESLRKPTAKSEKASGGRYYETPWIIVFDRVHWEYNDSELHRFRNEMEKRGRSVCLLVISGPHRGLSYFDTSVFRQIGELSHVVSQDQARQLGKHLNRFLRRYGKARAEWQWDHFYRDHTVRYLEGVSTFWVSLSFWIRGQYDLSESIQEWMYRSFKEHASEGTVQSAILEIAAMSSERLPMPEGLLPMSQNKWPTSQLLEDSKLSLGGLGLFHTSAKGERYWALVHDILGRFLINALFHDFPWREQLGFGAAKDPEHLRFLLLKKISQKRELGERVYRQLGEDFATTIFKIDPDHGYASFTPLWREVLHALDSMASPLRDNSRVFRHHTAVSRRRVAKLNESIYGVRSDDKIKLLKRAIADITYALNSIDYTPGSEPNLNLYNSLAHAFFDLARLERAKGEPAEYVDSLRAQARDATRRAYEESPTNSFVIETYVRDLLDSAEIDQVGAIEYCIKALGILFSAISSNEQSYRRATLGDYADKALDIISRHTLRLGELVEPNNPIDVLTRAWIILAKGVDYKSGTALSELPEKNRILAVDALAHPKGQGNMQVIRLTYDLICVTYPYDFKKQMYYLEQLQGGDYRRTPQLRLEYGVLLYQNDRPKEGDRIFRDLRRLWRESEHFVSVPQPLRWLRDSANVKAKTVRAFVSSDYGLRSMARVREFQNLLVPLRTEEFSLLNARPGTQFSARVSFGHNGPFLRPVTSTAT